MNFGLWMLDFRFLLFLVPSFSFHNFLFKNLQLWDLDGRYVNSNFSQPTFLSKLPSQTAARMNFGWQILDSYFSWFLFLSQFSVQKTCNCEHCMVKLWIPTFLMRNFPFKVVFQKTPGMNFGQVDLEEEAGGTINTFLIPRILWNFCLFMVLEHILSLVLRSCPGTGLAKMNVGWSILDS